METARGASSGASDAKLALDRGEVYKVSVRIPPFWPEEPEIWFAQVEGQFAINKITSDLTKFNYIIGQLEHQYAKEVKDIIVSPPADNKYDKLKAELIKRLTASKEKKLKQLLMHEELGDRKPSCFLRHLQSLAGPNISDEFLKTIWTSRLPHGMQTVLAGQSSTAALEDLADLADRVNDLATATPSVSSVGQSSPSSIISDLTREVAELRRQLQKLTTQQSGRSKFRTARSRNRSSSRQRSQSNYRKFPVCWYHSKFGEKASKCVQPCDYKPENPKGSR